MNKKTTRFLAGSLAALMLSTSPFSSFATDFKDVEEKDYSIVDKVVASGVMIGTDNGFEGNKELTRAESVAIMVRLKGISEETVKASQGKTNYSDVSQNHWASGYINVATSLGLVEGIGEGKFAPDQKVSYAETATMLVRALGAGKVAELDGTWPTNYMNFAMDEKITDGVYKATMAIVNRMETAQMVANTLVAPMWVKSGGSTNGSVDYSKDPSKTLLSESLELTEIKDKKLNDIDLDARTVTINGNEYDLAQDIRILVEEGMQVDAWVNKKDNVVYLGASEDAEQNVISFNGIKSSSITENNSNDDNIKVYVDGNAKEYELIDNSNGDTEVIINGVGSKTLEDLKNAIDTTNERENSEGKLIIEDGKIKQIVLNQYDEVMIVKKIVDKKIYNNNDIINHSNEDLDGKDYLIVDEKGTILEIDDIEEDDVIHFAKEGSTYRMMVLRDNTASGVITAKASTGKYIKLDGERFDINMLVNPSIDELKDEVKLYLDKNGKIIACDLIESEVDTNIGIVTEAAGINNTRGEISAEVEITLLDGTEMDVKELNIKEIEENFENENLFNDTSITEINKQLYAGNDESDLIGQMVRFKITDDKIEIVEFESKFKSYDGTNFETLANYSSDDELELVNIAGYKINKEDMKLTKSGSQSYRINSDTVVILEDNNTGDAYKTEIEIVDFDSLKDNSSVNITLAKVDEDTNTVKYMYIRESENVARETNDNYGIIKDVAQTDEDGVYTLTILSNRGEVELEVDNGTDYDQTYVGKLVSYTEDDDCIVGIEVKDSTTSTLKEAKVAKFNDGTIKLSTSANGDATEVIDIDEKLTFISAESITKDGENFEFTDLQIGDESDIEEMGKDETFNTSDETSTTIYFVQVDNDGDGNADNGIGLIFYERD